MSRTVLWVLTAGALLAADAGKGDANKKDMKKMQGDWALLSMIKDGEKVPDEEAQVLFRTVKDDHYTVYRFDQPIAKWTFSIDASKKPKTIDILPDGAKDKNKAVLGIYEFDGDKLKICYAPAGKERPKEFVSKAGMTQTLAVWEQEKK
jgi:uncharacterized protein (TIGR03067 family)